MGRKDIAKDGVETRFSSTTSPQIWTGCFVTLFSVAFLETYRSAWPGRLLRFQR